jgi:DNA-directed RNA polymerase II subunit RPB2
MNSKNISNSIMKKSNKTEKISKTLKTSNSTNITNENNITNANINNLSTNEIFRLADLFFNKKNCIFSHQYDSYNKFIEEDVKNFLEYGEHVFTEVITTSTYFKYRFKFENIMVDGPTMNNGIEPMFPSDARHNNYTYSIKILADVTQYQDIIDIVTDQKITKQNGETEKSKHIATIPLMVGSKWCSLQTHKDVDKSECKFDSGGNFIVNGNEKIIIPQDRMCENKALVFIKKDSGAMFHTVQCNSKSYKPHGISQVISVRMKKDEIMTLRIPILSEVNVCIVLKALGFESDRSIINCITHDEYDSDIIDKIRASLDACKNEKGIKISTQEEAIEYLVPKLRVLKKYTETDAETKKIQKQIHLRKLLQNNFLPHVDGTLIDKGYFLGLMLQNLLNVVLERRSLDDRDSYENKRVDLTGDIMFESFRQAHKKAMGEPKKIFEARNKNVDKPINVISTIKPNITEQQFKASLSTGKFLRRQGVAQILQRLNFSQTQTSKRRVDAPGGDVSSSKLTTPRCIHPSSVPFLCCVQTPEHAKVGLTKHLTMISTITIMSRDQYELLKNYLNKKIKNKSDIPYYKFRNYNIFKVFLNGDWIGMTENFIDLISEMEKLKLEGYFDQKNVSIVPDYDQCEIRVYCDSGRLVRPVIRVIDNEILLKKDHIKEISLNKVDNLLKITDWDEFLLKNVGVIEYIDSEYQPFLHIASKIKNVEEQRQKLINSIDLVKNVTNNHIDNRYDEMMYNKFSHCEIHPSLLLGEITTNVPFSNKNAGPRNVFFYAQARQAMGIYATNYRDRLDISFILYHVERPLVTTRTAKYTNSTDLPTGENCIVAIICYTGYNQEDSLVFNKKSIERGKFRGTYLKKFMLQVQKNHSNSPDEILTKPDPSKLISKKYGSYDKLNDKGYAPEETKVENGDVVLGKITPVEDNDNTGKCFKDSSESFKMLASGVVDRAYIDVQNQDGYMTRKLSIRSERIPRHGDKYSSRHGQKGTIGLLCAGVDMPFTKDGVTPDIILNPHAKPSRMTLGQTVECLVGKVALLEGKDADGTPFEDFDLESIKDKLEKFGYERNGNEYLYNGMTGEKIKTEIFIGPTYYQRLKHLVEDKIHSRARGPKTLLVRQAPEGRSRDGGLRLGEMERDSLLGHGIAKFIKEKLLDNSDAYTTFVCGKCGLFAQRYKLKEYKNYAQDSDIYCCPPCNNYTDVHKVKIPYAFKLFCQEMMAMCIAPRIRFNTDIYEL